mmetsp:Transcript_5137/g.9833  ORF Transcript_5137/g.9833 Transcript_5137/m.9833 type:complete len:395 (-) Transcript_5137:241-1425(-)
MSHSTPRLNAIMNADTPPPSPLNDVNDDVVSEDPNLTLINETNNPDMKTTPPTPKDESRGGIDVVSGVNSGFISEVISSSNSSSSNNTNNTNNTNNNTINTTPHITHKQHTQHTNTHNTWVTCLSSTPNQEYTNPSTSSYHGIGLGVAYSRSKALSTLTNKQSQLIDTYANSTNNMSTQLLKYSKQMEATNDAIITTNPTVHHKPNNNSDSDSESKPSTAAAPPPPPPLCVTFSHSLSSFAKQAQFLSITLRSSVARPMLADADHHLSACNDAYARYSELRKACTRTRQAAVKARQKYVKNVKEAEQLVLDVLRLKGEVEEKRRKKAENGSASGPEADAGGDPSPPPATPTPTPPMRPPTRTSSTCPRPPSLQEPSDSSTPPSPPSAPPRPTTA